MLTNEHIERRKPLWEDLSDLWNNTELFDYQLKYIAEKMRSSGYSLAELEEILAEEVAPVVYGNVFSYGGTWTGFDSEWLYKGILENLKKQKRNPIYRAWVKSSLGKFVMTKMIEEDWKKVVELYKNNLNETKNPQS